MSEIAPDPRPAETYAEVEDALLSRWPESRLDPTLDRIEAFTELLGDPQRAYPVIHLTGTNGKTSTARMIETLLRGLGLRTGRFTSPHLESMTERIVIDGEPLAEEEFVRAFNDVAPYTHLVDAEHDHPLSFFETVVAMAYAAFADAPVDVAVVEVGMGGAWDATNVADGEGRGAHPDRDRPREVPRRHGDEDRGREGRDHQAGRGRGDCGSAGRVAAQIAERAAEVGATLAREGVEFGVRTRVPAVGGQLLSLQGLRGVYDEVFLPLYGAHQAQNAAVALAAVEAFVGGDDPLAEDVVRDAFAEVTSPGRLEVVRRSPTIVLDAAHNPHGAAALVDAPGGLLHLQPADRRGRGDGGQGLRGRAVRARTGVRAHRLHPELHGARPAGPRAGGGRPRDLRPGPGRRGRLARRRDRPGDDPGRGGRRLRRGARLAAACSSPAR